MAPRYRMRAAIRVRAPWWLIERGFAGKGPQDCGDHVFYNHDGERSTTGLAGCSPRHFVSDPHAVALWSVGGAMFAVGLVLTVLGDHWAILLGSAAAIPVAASYSAHCRRYGHPKRIFVPNPKRPAM